MTTVFIVDAFTSEKFCGNQAAVCLFDQKKTDGEYQKIAAEFNLSETAFPMPLDTSVFKTASKFSLRWFTPKVEVPLCGHATLATVHVIFHHVENVNPTLFFETLSGEVSVTKVSDGQYKINFPLYKLKCFVQSDLLGDKFEQISLPSGITDIYQHFEKFAQLQGAVYCEKAKILIVIVDENLSREEFTKINNSADFLLKCDPESKYLDSVILSMKPKNAAAQGFVDKDGKAYDYASRFFGPWLGIAEDPATGSSHCYLAALWKEFHDKEELYAFQSYPGRGGQFVVKPVGDRIEITGEAVTVIEGKANF